MTHSSKQTVLGMRHTFERRLQLRRREHNHPHASWALNKSETTLALHALQPGEPGGIRHGDVRGRRARNDHNSSKLASNRKDEVRDGLIYSLSYRTHAYASDFSLCKAFTLDWG